MPKTQLRVISKVQPMREGEIALVEYVNGDLTAYIEEETQERLSAEKVLTDNLSTEVSRATAAEKVLTDNLSTEVSRATQKESELFLHIESETDRAVKAETELSNKITAETNRATKAENGLEEHIQTAESDIETKISELGGNGLNFDTSTNKLNVLKANKQTFGGVKLKHEVDNDVSDEWAVTSYGVYSYAPSKAETTAQPNSFDFTEIQEGVTLSVQNAVRIGGLMLLNLRVQCGTNTTISSNTKFATPPELVGGVGIGSSMNGVCIQISQVSLFVNKALEPNSDTYFTVLFPYKAA